MPDNCFSHSSIARKADATFAAKFSSICNTFASQFWPRSWVLQGSEVSRKFCLQKSSDPLCRIMFSPGYRMSIRWEFSGGISWIKSLDFYFQANLLAYTWPHGLLHRRCFCFSISFTVQRGNCLLGQESIIVSLRPSLQKTLDLNAGCFPRNHTLKGLSKSDHQPADSQADGHERSL